MRRVDDIDFGPRTPPADRRDAEEVHVVYIAGMGRSGSTLLNRTLGSIGGFLGTGELMRIICRGVSNGDLCGCGAPVSDCELWSAVLREVDRRSPNLDLVKLERTRRRVTEGWDFLRYLFLPPRASGLERELNEYRDFLTTLYRSIRTVTGARVIVDASKNVLFARVLTEIPSVRVSFVHLVRDSRGVAYSLTKKKLRPGTPGRVEYFRPVGTVLGPILWSAANVMTECLRERATHYVRVRYEDFVAAPSATVERILRALALTHLAPSLGHVNGRSVRLGIDHVIASNPNRARHGEIALCEDLEWQVDMRPSRRWLVTALTLPLLRRYGYRVLTETSDNGIEVAET